MATEHKIKKYFEAVGRRKTAVARVRVFAEKGEHVVNNKPLEKYFPTTELKHIAYDALDAVDLRAKYRVQAKITGGGSHAQAEALRHALSRAILLIDGEQRKTLKRLGYLKRDPRAKERRKFGLKKARKAPQWAKR